ncbi:MAG: UDP-3-O-(3-hydroxymyristoyl)glucosamine N-acyltransferase, partial [Verrucomicrobiales bacterium]|nr:UDP-3-O-(3-hydroxymyristoyl)glucosamine N-acyltransferase [Verrucomicrobiales bacterium]
MEVTLKQVAEMVGGRITKGDEGFVLKGFAAVADAQVDDLTFFGNDRYLNALKEAKAGAVLLPEGFSQELANVQGTIEVASPSGAFAVVVEKFGAPPRRFEAGVHPSAVVHPTVKFDPEKVSIKALAVVDRGCEIGDGTEIAAGSVIGEGTVIGEGCLIHANVTVREGARIGNRVILQSGCVIGADGFGYEMVEGRFVKIEQVGIVELEDDVEVGANSTIDRARFGYTRIGEGTKIDNLVQIAHNCVIGKHSAAAAQVGVAGSARVGNHTLLAGKVGVNGHVSICDQVIVMGDSGVTKDIVAPGKYLGYPAAPAREELKVKAAGQKLPGMIRRVKELEK